MSRRRQSLLLLLAGLAAGSAIATAAEAPLPITDKSFGCMTKMTPVRGFFVASLNGHLKETLAVANSAGGGVYPPGSVVQLIPTEVMVKQPSGTNPATKDWEFFELDVSAKGSTIRHRGYVDVVNRFGGNCFGCHVVAKPQFDLVCEESHGCAPIPVTRAMIEGLQRSDPRCVPPNALRPQDVEGLKAFKALTEPKPAKP